MKARGSESDKIRVVLFEVCIQGFGEGRAGKDEVEGTLDRMWDAWTDTRRVIKRTVRGGPYHWDGSPSC